MAVPFNMPEDHNEVEVIITQLQYLLTKLQAALRRSRETNFQNTLSSQVAHTRVRTNSSNRSRERDDTVSTTSSTGPSSGLSSNLPDLFDNLTWLAAASQEVIDSSSQQTTAVPLIRPARIRTSSESSCCEESKVSVSNSIDQGNIQEWNQETEHRQSYEPESEKSYLRDGILSRIVPGPVSAPIWTAMICFVGWHIFRAR